MIYCVEDDDSIRDLIIYALKNEGYEAKGAVEAKEFYELLKEGVPNLILLDIMLPGGDGLEILSNLKKSKYKDIPVIMLTAKNSEIDKVRGLDLGADDYVTKPFSVLELMARIRALLRRNHVHEDDSIEFEGIKMDEKTRKTYLDGEEISLSYKEYELLKYLIKNSGLVLSREQITNAIWGYDYEGESRTVDVHIAFLRQKLGKKGNLIRTVRNVGYILEGK